MDILTNLCTGLPLELRLILVALVLLAMLPVKNAISAGNATHGYRNRR